MSTETHFTKSGASPPRTRKPARIARDSHRYIRQVSYIVARDNVPAHREKLDGPELVAGLARRLILDDDREHFYVFFVDSQNRLLAAHHVSTGSLSASIVHPREVLGPAIREGAAHLVLVHNHPSGDPTPSREDIALTRQLTEGGRLLGLRVHDHVIIGSGTGSFTSLAQRGLL